MYPYSIPHFNCIGQSSVCFVEDASLKYSYIKCERVLIMADKELKRMNRGELIEIIYQYRIQVDDLTAQVKKLTDELDERRLRMEKAGSIAEAAISVNKVFEAAQQAAEQYLYSIKSANEENEESADGSCEAADEIIENAKKEAEKIKQEAERKYSELVTKGEKEYAQMLAQAERKCDDMRKTVLQLMLASGKDHQAPSQTVGESE